MKRGKFVTVQKGGYVMGFDENKVHFSILLPFRTAEEAAYMSTTDHHIYKLVRVARPRRGKAFTEERDR